MHPMSEHLSFAVDQETWTEVRRRRLRSVQMGDVVTTRCRNGPPRPVPECTHKPKTISWCFSVCTFWRMNIWRNTNSWRQKCEIWSSGDFLRTNLCGGNRRIQSETRREPANVVRLNSVVTPPGAQREATTEGTCFQNLNGICHFVCLNNDSNQKCLLTYFCVGFSELVENFDCQLTELCSTCEES